jgi:hypothetical protein
MTPMTAGTTSSVVAVGVAVVNALRVLVIAGGGAVIGAGTVILLERARFYQRHDVPEAVVAMRALIVVNVLTLTFVSLVLISKWDDWLTWRLPVATAIFVSKGVFFHLLRQTGVEQERRALYGEWSGTERRGAAADRRVTCP